MKSSIKIKVEFSFKGKSHALSSTVDLDESLSKFDIMPSFHAIIAENSDIDTYSYLYEVMEDADLEFSDAAGLASGFLKEGHFDLEGFVEKWRENRILDLLRPVAKGILGIDLDSDPRLRTVLIEAYKLGKGV